MPEAQNTAMRKRSAGITAVICVVAAILFLALFLPLKFKIKHTTIEKRMVWGSSGQGSWDEGFSHEIWDGPTGTFSSGDIYAFKFGPVLWRLDVYSGDP